ncbi:MAG: sigma 54-interacting transcriptional regulator, partial [Opitutaceae bacterium]
TATAIEQLEAGGFDAVFLGGGPGAENAAADAASRVLRLKPQLPVVVMGEAGAAALEAVRRGAFDSVPRPCGSEQIRGVVRRIEKARALERHVRSLENELVGASAPVDFESAEPAMRRALEIAFRAAETPATILLLGPSGTGKSFLAREIHRRGPQPEAPFVTVSCPSLHRDLLESDLFGHVKGAFTGAIADAAGKVAAADGGTLFFDEIGDMPLDLQPKLLRLLQEREYERVGETEPRRANVRVIAATNRNLAEEVRAGRFREDLFYRLNVIAIVLPGLKDRPGDLARLIDERRAFFADRLGKKILPFSPPVQAALAAYAWPGNLRELNNVIERAVILARGDTIGIADLPEEIRGGGRSLSVGARVSLEELESEHIRRILTLALNLDEAARILGIDPATLYRKRQRLGLLRRAPRPARHSARTLGNTSRAGGTN